MDIQIKTIKPKVEEILKHSQEARNSDKELILRVWHACGLILDEKQREIYRKIPHAESIRRTRQKFQEEGKYLADKQIIEAREENRKNMVATNPRIRPHYCNKCEQVMILSEALICRTCQI